MPLRTVAGQTKSGGARLFEHGWAGLSDFYEPYLLLEEMSGNYASISMARLNSSLFGFPKPAGVQNPDISKHIPCD